MKNDNIPDNDQRYLKVGKEKLSTLDTFSISFIQTCDKLYTNWKNAKRKN